jgi:outer membrane immunogenic protein
VKAPPKPADPFSWNGCYVGGFVGGAWSQNSTARDLNGYNSLGDTWSYRVGSSVIGGGTLGCNQTIGQNFVLGIEGEGGYMHLRGAALDSLSPFIPLDTTASTRIGDAYGLLAMRAGFAVNRTLFYAKAGAALTNAKVSVVDPVLAGGNTINAVDSTNKNAIAFAVGGGLEYAFTDKWSVKAEYLYLDFRRTNLACGNATIGGGLFCWSVTVPNVSTAKIGLNYKLN